MRLLPISRAADPTAAARVQDLPAPCPGSAQSLLNMVTEIDTITAVRFLGGIDPLQTGQTP